MARAVARQYYIRLVKLLRQLSHLEEIVAESFIEFAAVASAVTLVGDRENRVVVKSKGKALGWHASGGFRPATTSLQASRLREQAGE